MIFEIFIMGGLFCIANEIGRVADVLEKITDKGGGLMRERIKRFYEKHFKSHCPDCNGVMDSIGWEWGRNIYECRQCKRWWL